MKDTIYDLVIIGGGIAAFSAALYAGRFKMRTVLIGENLGGTLLNTHDIENYPGFAKISGMELMEKIQSQAKQYDVEIVEAKAEEIMKRGHEGFTVTAGGREFQTKSIIYATGTEWRKLNVPGEKEYTGKGVSYCALCDGVFYKDKTIAVVGGSDAAAKEALLLSEYGKKVYIIYRKEKIRAEPITAHRVSQNPKIEVIPNTNILEIKGGKFVDHVILDKPYKGSMEFKVDGLFLEIGHIPLSGLAKQIGVHVNEKDEIIADQHGHTNIRGFYAAGDVIHSPFKQAITAAAQGVVSAYSAYQYLSTTIRT